MRPNRDNVEEARGLTDLRDTRNAFEKERGSPSSSKDAPYAAVRSAPPTGGRIEIKSESLRLLKGESQRELLEK